MSLLSFPIFVICVSLRAPRRFFKEEFIHGLISLVHIFGPYALKISQLWPMGQIGLFFVNKILLKYDHTHLFIYYMTLFLLQQQSWALKTVIYSPWSQKYFLSGPLQKRFADFYSSWRFVNFVDVFKEIVFVFWIFLIICIIFYCFVS